MSTTEFQRSDPDVNNRPVKTYVACTNCGKSFVAEIDARLDGNHIIHCCFCNHEHCRKVEKGKVTDIRFDSKAQTHEVERRRIWRAGVLPIQTSSAAEFIRQAWLERLT